MSNATPNTGTSINSDTMITVNSIHHPGGDEQSYWDLITIKTTDIDSKYIGRKGYGKLVITGLDSLKSSLDDSLINLRAILYTGGSYSNLIEGTGKEFQLYLDYMYDYDIDNIGMTIELTWVYDNDQIIH